MCLEVIKYQNLTPKDEDWKIGYRIYIPKGNTHFVSPFIGVRHKFGRTYKVTIEDYVSCWDDDDTEIAYKAGFHIFPKLEEANYYLHHHLRLNQNPLWLPNMLIEAPLTIVKVKYRHICASGYQFCAECDVAEELELLEVV